MSLAKKYEQRYIEAANKPTFSLSAFMKEMVEDMRIDVLQEVTEEVAKNITDKRKIFGETIELCIHNDGKEKHQSWEAFIKSDTYNPNGIDIEFGYGSTKEEAIENFLEQFDVVRENFLNLTFYIQNRKFTEVMVDYAGVPIKL